MSEEHLEGVRRFQQDFKEQMAEFDKNLTDARIISRDLIYKIIFVCSSIIGFSLTLISIPQLGLRTNIEMLKTSWYLFLATIIVGFLSLFLEGRLHYALKWRSIQVQDFDEQYSYPFIDKLKVWFVCVYSLFSPRNLIFCRIYETPKEKKYNALLNAKAVITLAELEKLTFFVENLFIVSFVAGLLVFVGSYQ